MEEVLEWLITETGAKHILIMSTERGNHLHWIALTSDWRHDPAKPTKEAHTPDEEMIISDEYIQVVLQGGWN